MFDPRQFIHAAGMFGIGMFSVPSLASATGGHHGGTKVFGGEAAGA